MSGRRHRFVRSVGAALVLAAALFTAGARGQAASTDGAGGKEALGVELGLPAPLGTPLSGAELARATEEVSSRLRCPVCQGLSVADSPSESARAMREQVTELLASGYTQEQIVAYFERSYGEFVRLVPKPRGFNLLAFALPALALLAGAALVVRFVRRGGTDAPGAGASASDEELAAYRARVRRELGG